MISQNGLVGVSGGGIGGKMIANTSVKWICTCDHVVLFFFLINEVSSDLVIHVCEMYEPLLKQHLQLIGCYGIKNVPRCPQCFFCS